MLGSGRLLLELCIGAACERLVSLSDQVIFFKNAQLGPSLAWRSIQGRIFGFYWFHSLFMLTGAERETKLLGPSGSHCGSHCGSFCCSVGS